MLPTLFNSSCPLYFMPCFPSVCSVSSISRCFEGRHRPINRLRILCHLLIPSQPFLAISLPCRKGWVSGFFSMCALCLDFRALGSEHHNERKIEIYRDFIGHCQPLSSTEQKALWHIVSKHLLSLHSLPLPGNGWDWEDFTWKIWSHY